MPSNHALTSNKNSPDGHYPGVQIKSVGRNGPSAEARSDSRRGGQLG